VSFEAVFSARRIGSSAPFAEKWLTVPSNDRAAAREAFRAIGYETRGGSILNEAEARAAAERI